jgi:hypothetical protein
MILGEGRRAGWLALPVVALAYGAYLAVFLPLVPAGGKALGADYLLHLPNLLAGYFLYLRDGLFAVPWFNPAQCGGVPFLADLNVGFYSVPQFLSFIVDPLQAVRLTFAIFAALGAAGFYLLARRAFAMSAAAAAVAAVLFLFNGCFAYRMAIGHLTFHPLMLAPWIALALIRGSALGALVAGALFAYAFQSGMIHGIGPLAFATAAVILIHGMRTSHRWQAWAAFAASVVVAVALSAARLAAAIAFAENFPRAQYPLPGFTDLVTALRVALESLFYLPPVAEAWSALANTGPFLDREEWEYGLGPIAALLILAGGALLLLRHRAFVAHHARAIACVVAILALPLLLNWYVPAWNGALKQVPLLGSSTTLVRWFIVYIPVAVLLAALSFDALVEGGARLVAMVAVVVTIVVPNWLMNKSSYAGHYDAAPIVEAWHRGAVAPVASIVVNPASTPERPVARGANNAIATGASQLNCYQPVFGYQLETFPRGNLRPGPVTEVTAAGTLNLKNPACYLFPAANSCAPGAEFRVDEIAEAEAFAHYRPFPFARPPLQVAAGWLNLAALVAWLLAVPVLLLRRRAGGAAPPRLDAMRPAR